MSTSFDKLSRKDRAFVTFLTKIHGGNEAKALKYFKRMRASQARLKESDEWAAQQYRFKEYELDQPIGCPA